MKKALPLLALVVAGCHVKVDEPPPAIQQQVTAASAYTAPQEPTNKTPVAETTKKGYNAKRIHQLYEIPTAVVKVDDHPITAWLMTDESMRQEGMMFLTDSDFTPDQGMLFVFPDSDKRGFWMHNTLVPLDVAYIGPDKKVLNVAHMKALDESTTPSNGKAQYVLEMKSGTIERLGLHAGSTVSFPDSVKSSD